MHIGLIPFPGSQKVSRIPTVSVLRGVGGWGLTVKGRVKSEDTS